MAFNGLNEIAWRFVRNIIIANIMCMHWCNMFELHLLTISINDVFWFILALNSNISMHLTWRKFNKIYVYRNSVFSFSLKLITWKWFTIIEVFFSYSLNRILYFNIFIHWKNIKNIKIILLIYFCSTKI